MKSFEQDYLSKLQIPQHLISMIRQIGEYKGRQELYQKQAPEMLENLRRIAVIQSTESSNRLEGITADPKRIKELVEGKTRPQNRSEAEIAGYRDVLNTLHSNSQHIPFNERIILQLHRDLMKYAGKEGGRWKSVPNQISEILPDGTKRIRFVPVEPMQTPEYMQILHERFRDLVSEQSFDPLILIPLYILDFLCIHPFLDGNGRMARLLTVLLLYHQGYEVVRYISLERIVEQTRESYYETLNRSSQNWHDARHDVLPWMEYFLSTILAAYREFENRLGAVSSGHGSKTDMVMNAIEGFIGDFSLADLEHACPAVGRDWIRKLLQRLKAEGKIEALGKGRFARWRKVQ
jgi:Fic family protein